MIQLIRIDNASLNAWREDDLTSATVILSQKMQDGDHHRLANLALVRTRLKQWDSAEQDARASIQVQPTILAHVAMSIVLSGQGKLASAKQEFNRVFLCSEPKSECLLLLIKSIIIFVAGGRDEAVKRVTDIVRACAEADKAFCLAVQAQMQLLVGRTALNEQDYEKALRSFASAGASAPFSKLPELETISLMFGWDFNSLLLAIRQQTCEAQYAASQMSEAVESLRTMLDEFGAEIKTSVKLSDWLENFTRGCVKALETAGDTAAAAGNHDEAIAHYSLALSLDPPSRADLVAKQNKVQLAVGAWDDSMKGLDEVGASPATMYTQVGEGSLQAGRGKEAAEMSRRLSNDLGEDGKMSGGQHQALPATTTQIIQVCSQFRLLLIGNAGVGKSSLICTVFGVERVHTSKGTRGAADIDQEVISSTNDRFVVHDSLGFEPGDEDNMEIVKQFVARRKAMPQLKDQLHAVWLCLEIPCSGGRLLEAGVEKFLRRRKEILGKIPLVVVLTKVDLFDLQLEIDQPANETLEHYKSRNMNQHCMKPLHEAAGNDVTHVTVSTEDGYSESLFNLLKATNESMAKYHVGEAPRVLASIAQRISIKEKIELSIAIGKKRYWKMLLKSAVFRGHTLKECLQVISKEIITVWNFNDPDQWLLDDKIIDALLRTDNLGDDTNASSNVASFASSLASSVALLRGLSGSGVTLAVLAPVARIAISPYARYREAKKDVKILMAYIVDLICLMQAIFLLASGDRVTPETIALAVKAYETPRKIVHLLVDGFDGKQGVLPGGRDYALEKIEALIWRHSIPDNEIQELRQRIGQALAPSGSGS